MEKEATQPTFLESIKVYWQIIKPGILLGNIFTAIAGFFLASKEASLGSIGVAMLLGLGLIMAAGCVGNNYIDRMWDEKMKRTQKRALVRGDISEGQAVWLAAILGFAGTLILTMFTPFLTTVLALLGLFFYVFLYSFIKHHSYYATYIGSLAGATPPIIGYSAAKGFLDVGGLLLFAMLVLWQMPHFFAIAIYHLEDYIAADIPVFPLKKGMVVTKVHMLFYIAAFAAVSYLLYVYQYVGTFYLATVAILTGIWFLLGIRGLFCKEDKAWARQMFTFSLVVILGISFMLCLD